MEGHQAPAGGSAAAKESKTPHTSRELPAFLHSHIFAASQIFAAADRVEVRSEMKGEWHKGGLGLWLFRQGAAEAKRACVNVAETVVHGLEAK